MNSVSLPKHEFGIYHPRGITITEGTGSTVRDSTGQTYIDCVAGHGAAALGHAHPEVVDAIQQQASTLLLCPGAFANPVRSRFLTALAGLLPPSLHRTFLCNSGSEAVDAAIKFARFHTGKTEIITAMRGFHGRTMGAMSATFTPAYREPFAPQVPGFRYVPFNRIEALESALTADTAAVILEIIQGEGGVYPADPIYLHHVRQLCSQRDILLIVDEIQTGFCRTGKWFAFQHAGITPDMVVLAKAIAGGMPMGAVVCGEDIRPPAGLHGSTFGGNPLACAAGLASIGIMEKLDLANIAAEKGTYLLNRLAGIASPLIREIRGRGLMIGMELKQKAKPVIDRLSDRGVLVLPAGPRVIRLLPPLIIPTNQLDQVVETLDDVLGDLQHQQ